MDRRPWSTFSTESAESCLRFLQWKATNTEMVTDLFWSQPKTSSLNDRNALRVDRHLAWGCERSSMPTEIFRLTYLRHSHCGSLLCALPFPCRCQLSDRAWKPVEQWAHRRHHSSRLLVLFCASLRVLWRLCAGGPWVCRVFLLSRFPACVQLPPIRLETNVVAPSH